MDERGLYQINNHVLNQIISIQSCLAEANFDVNAFMELVVNQMQLLTPASGVVIEIAENDEMVYRAATGTVKNHVGLRLKMENSISGLCVRTQQVLCSDDTEKDPRVNLEACRKVKARSMLVAPLIHEGSAIGVLKILSYQPYKFNEMDVKTVKLIAGFIAAGLAHQFFYEKNTKLYTELTKAYNELKNAKEKLDYLANHDYLTDLPNRRLFYQKLTLAMSKAKRKNSLLAIIFLDIDHFKNINDTLGHDIGDILLRIFSQRIKECLRDYDIIARLGGDEFIILLDEINEKKNAHTVCQNIIAKVNQPFKLKDELLNITTSLGIAYYQNNEKSLDTLIKQGDQALYLAKRNGRNQYCEAKEDEINLL